MNQPVIKPPSALWAAAVNKHLIPALQKQGKPVVKKGA